MKNINFNRTSDTSVISLDDLMRIREHIIPLKNEEEEVKNRDEQLKQKSLSRMRKWPDSLDMAKKNQLEARKKIFFEKEMEKRKLDDEEKKFNEYQKELIVERANRIMFENQDNVKSFNSAMMMSDFLKEREFQMDIVKRKKEVEEIIEDKWNMVEKDNMDKYDQREIDKAEEEKSKKKQQVNMISRQFKDQKIRKIREYQDRVVEGEMIKKKAKQALEDDKLLYYQEKRN